MNKPCKDTLTPREAETLASLVKKEVENTRDIKHAERMPLPSALSELLF